MPFVNLYNRRQFITTTSMALASIGIVLPTGAQILTSSQLEKNSDLFKNELSSLANASYWINAKAITQADLKGKVVLVNFWTYTCINWLRTLPYLRAWAEKYKEQGLVVIGVHTPEFGFEQNIENVQQSVKDMHINYPIGIDNERSIWNAFDNNCWPAVYLIDSKGEIRHHQFGEGEYEKTENTIKQLLMESGVKSLDAKPVILNGGGIELAADWNNLQSGENYLGAGRTEHFVSRLIKQGPSHIYTSPSCLQLNEWCVNGVWTINNESILLNKRGGSIGYSFHARDLHIVMGTAKQGNDVRFRVSIEGAAPQQAHGLDIDEDGNGKIRNHRLYQLIRQSGTITDKRFEIEFFDAGAEAFSFTFG